MSEFVYRANLDLVPMVDRIAAQIQHKVDQAALDKIADTLEQYGYVKVVRCRDCVKRSKESDPPVCGPGKVDSWIDWCIKHNCEVEPDGFCAWGKRREGAES